MTAVPPSREHQNGSGQAPSISVIVPHYNDLANLGRCLALLCRQVVDKPFEIVVADNNSTCDPAELAALCADERIRLVNAPLQGAAEARNAGVAASRAPLLAFIDSDCHPDADWLRTGMNALDRAPLVGGRVDVMVPNKQRMTSTEAFERIFAFNNARYIREERFSVTANMFTTRAVFDHVGGFRAGVSEDREWGQRAAALGYGWLYEPAARLEHPARRDWNELHRKWRRLMAESFLLARERHGHPARWILHHWLMLLGLPMALSKAARSHAVETRRDRLGAMAVLVRLRVWRFLAAHQMAVGGTGRSRP